MIAYPQNSEESSIRALGPLVYTWLKCLDAIGCVKYDFTVYCLDFSHFVSTNELPFLRTSFGGHHLHLPS